MIGGLGVNLLLLAAPTRSLVRSMAYYKVIGLKALTHRHTGSVNPSIYIISNLDSDISETITTLSETPQ
jgi:hypothetical protein